MQLGDDRPQPDGPERTILVAGVHRSGSTWVYNALRFLLIEAGREFHAAWIKDYDRDNPAPWHLVKAHHGREVSFQPDLILTTARNRHESVASLVRIGWVADTDEAIVLADQRLARLYTYWDKRSDLEIAYTDILERPAHAIAQLANALSFPASAKQIGKVAAKLAGQKEPASDHYDPVTLLHPNHRNPEPDKTDLLGRVKRALYYHTQRQKN